MAETMMHPDPIRALEADLDGGLWLTLLALADAHEEAGRDGLPRAYRWLAKNRRRPFQRGSARRPVYYWQVGKGPQSCGGLPEHRFSTAGLSRWNNRRGGYDWHAFGTLALAYAAAAAAWVDAG